MVVAIVKNVVLVGIVFNVFVGVVTLFETIPENRVLVAGVGLRTLDSLDVSCVTVKDRTSAVVNVVFEEGVLVDTISLVELNVVTADEVPLESKIFVEDKTVAEQF